VSAGTVIRLNGVPLQFSSELSTAVPASGSTTVRLGNDKSVGIDAGALGAFGAGDFSVELTFRGTGEVLRPDDHGGALFIRSAEATSPYTGPIVLLHDSGTISFWIRADDKLLCDNGLPNPTSVTPRVLRFAAVGTKLSITVDGVLKCSHVQTLSFDSSKFTNAPMFFGRNQIVSTHQNLNAEISNIKLVEGATARLHRFFHPHGAQPPPCPAACPHACLPAPLPPCLHASLPRS